MSDCQCLILSPFFFQQSSLTVRPSPDLDAAMPCISLTFSSTPTTDYHWIGETFLGAWRVWSNYGFRSGIQLAEVKRVGFPNQYSKDGAPPTAKIGRDIWNDKPGANKWFTDQFL